VSIHEEYASITPWRFGETADIVYQDCNSILTNILVAKGYLEQSSWEGCSPRYYIEVKTTIGMLEAPFFCSQKQFDMMERMQLNEESSENIYLVARVFTLGTSGTGLKLYVDPATLRKQERLKFKADVYHVTPS
jgi:hypothetical protein